MAAGLRPPPGAPPDTRTGWSPVGPPYGPDQQFVAGRRAATEALTAAGATEVVVHREADGRPRFPPGFAGSISHTDRLAVAVVVPGAVAAGVDIESAAIRRRVANFVLRERERRTLLRSDGGYAARELFAAKEAAFKALYSAGELGNFFFWHVELGEFKGELVASYRGVSVPVRVRSMADIAFAVAIRR